VFWTFEVGVKEREALVGFAALNLFFCWNLTSLRYQVLFLADGG
jgi:hypothetical protein